MAHLDGAIDPDDLLARLHAIEAEAGRIRTVVNAARPLDLDIIAMGCQVRNAPNLILPHPRAHERGFVLAPLGDVAPGWVHPRLGLTAAALLSLLAASRVSIIGPPAV